MSQMTSQDPPSAAPAAGSKATVGQAPGQGGHHGHPEPHDAAGTRHGITGKGLKGGQLGLLAVVVLGISSVAPAYSLTSSLGPTVNAVGVQLPAIFIVAFIPMILVAFAYRELNADSPDSGTTFTWATKAFGPFVGWMGGWGLLAANIIVLSNLAGVAVDFFYLFLAQVFNDPVAGGPDLQQGAEHRHLPGLRGPGRLGQLPRPACHQTGAVLHGGLPGAGAGPVHRHGAHACRLRRHPHRHRLQLGLVQPREDLRLRPVRRRHVPGGLRLLGLGCLPDGQ